MMRWIQCRRIQKGAQFLLTFSFSAREVCLITSTLLFLSPQTVLSAGAAGAPTLYSWTIRRVQPSATSVSLSSLFLPRFSIFRRLLLFLLLIILKNSTTASSLLEKEPQLFVFAYCPGSSALRLFFSFFCWQVAICQLVMYAHQSPSCHHQLTTPSFFPLPRLNSTFSRAKYIRLPRCVLLVEKLTDCSLD